MDLLWAIVSVEGVYLEVKIDSNSSYIPLFRSVSVANNYIVAMNLGNAVEPRQFQFGPYDYIKNLTKSGHILYLRILEQQKLVENSLQHKKIRNKGEN